MSASSICSMTVELNLQEVSSNSTDSLLQGDAIAIEQWQDWIEKWLLNLHEQLPPADAYELTLRLTDDTEIQELNRQYRQQNKPTDVLAFAALEADVPIFSPDESEPLYLGDIIISLNTAARQAQEHNHSLTVELAWLASHGLLHLLGWDHPDDDSLEEMLAKQANLLQQVGLVTLI